MNPSCTAVLWSVVCCESPRAGVTQAELRSGERGASVFCLLCLIVGLDRCSQRRDTSFQGFAREGVCVYVYLYVCVYLLNCSVCAFIKLQFVCVCVYIKLQCVCVCIY